MGSTLIEKIIEKNTGLSKVTPGQIVTVNVDRVMIHDIFIPFVAEKFEEMGFTKLWDPDKVVLIYDHLVPTSAVEDVRHFKIGDAFADKYSLTHVHRRDGICHQLMTEYCFWYRFPYNNVWMCRLFFFWYWLHRDGFDTWYRRNVDSCSRNNQSSY